MEELDYKSSWTMPKRSRKLLCNSRKKKRIKDAKSMELHMSGGPTWIFLAAQSGGFLKDINLCKGKTARDRL